MRKTAGSDSPGPAAGPAPKLSVIVPVFNERRLVGELLRRLAAAPVPSAGDIEIIAVDDGSTDGSAEVVAELTPAIPGLRLLAQPDNRGKGAALRAGIAAATGDLIVFQDADLEYDPHDLEGLVRPLVEGRADAVYGSRFAGRGGQRVTSYHHEAGNRLITAISNLFTGLGLSDVETCYKMFRAPLLRDLPLVSDDFAIEVEITAKLARRGCRVVEVPITYHGRTYREGKKITWRDGLRAIAAIVRFRLADDR